MTWVLVAFFAAGSYGGRASLTVDFSSQENCSIAAKTLIDKAKDTGLVFVMCTKK